MNYRHGRSGTPEYQMLRDARKRALACAVPFSLSQEDIQIPQRCPVLGMVLDREAARLSPASPTLDRIVPALGYVVGNIAVISWRANKIKNDASREEILALARWIAAVTG